MILNPTGRFSPFERAKAPWQRMGRRLEELQEIDTPGRGWRWIPPVFRVIFWIGRQALAEADA